MLIICVEAFAIFSHGQKFCSYSVVIRNLIVGVNPSHATVVAAEEIWWWHYVFLFSR